ncbi:alpha/beta hydrolase [Pontiella agarivorans]|uniref:Alpha/beta hydrolase n=1 Tax=Pontiella agarivorans TaxID=3038953 RepID=A0ABU5MVT0_9BACT|nr:alpha/beta hydrolase [Pontiella agarivorans]MDZ8118325.1 alpha/beta hydrolase [Pontiella agarivorans]
MKKETAIFFALLTVSAGFAQRSAPTSTNDDRLKKLLERRPELDADNDGILTLAELRAARGQIKKQPQNNQRKRLQKRTPTFSDVSYGAYDSMTFDFWQAESQTPAPLFVFIHGGGFRSGDKSTLNPILLEGFLSNGVSVASINYRLSGIAPFPAQMHDSARAIQFLRSKAGAWNIHPGKVAAGGGSAGSGIAQWLAFHDDLKNPESQDPVEQQSTRLTCALAFSMQSTYDPRVIQKIIPGIAFDDSALKPFYGLPADWNWETDPVDKKLDALIKEASPINHLTADDPPVFIYHSEKTRQPGNIHHPDFGIHLAEAMDKLNIDYVRTTSADYDSRSAPFEAMVQFVLRYLK